jgi:hypothetical protein
MIDENPVKNLFLSTIGLKNIGSVAIIPSDFYEPLSINVDGSWKILLVKDDLREEHPIWKRVNDHKFEAVPELLNPDDAISVSVYTTNTQNDHPQLAQLKPWWSTHILNLKSITVKNNQLNFSDELAQNPVNKLVPIVVFLYGPGLLSTSIGTIFFMVIYMRLLYQLKIITRARWSSIAAIVGVSIISVTSSESMTTYFFPDIFTRLTGVYNWLNMPWIILNLVVLMWLSWKALRAARGPGYSIARGESQP